MPLLLRAAAVPLVLACAALVAGCSAAEDVASEAGSAASSAAAGAAEREVRQAVCPLVEDRQISDADRDALAGAIDVARAAGVDSPLLDDAEDVLGSDGTPPESTVARLAEDCAGS